MMGQYHFMRWFMKEGSLSFWLYQLIYIPGRISAPFFLMIAGISMVMFYNNYKKSGKSLNQIFTITLKRGIFLLFITIPLNFAALIIFQSGTIWEWNIFQLLGIGIMFSIFIGMWNLWFLIPSLTLVFFLNNVLPPSFLTVGIVPIIPWLNYFFVGSIMGIFIVKFYSQLSRRINYLAIVGVLMYAFTFIHFGFGGWVEVKHVLTERTTLPSMAIIAFFFIGTILLTETIKYYPLYFKMNFFKNLGFISLSVYYIHLLYKYAIVILMRFVGQGNVKVYSGDEYWLLINAGFWIPLFIFVNLIWKPMRFSYGVEWFMNKYISVRSVISGHSDV